MPSTIIASNVGSADASGRAQAKHTIFAVNSDRWWCFYLSASTTLAARYSNDGGITWVSAGATLTVPATGQEGFYLAVTYNNLGGTDVVHVECDAGSNGTNHFRGTIHGTSLTWDSGAALGTATTITGYTPGPAVALDSSGTVYVLSSCTQVGGAVGNLEEFASTGTDSGGSFTETFSAGATLWSATSNVSSNWLGVGASGNMLACCDNCPTNGTFTDIEYSWFNGTSWSAAAAAGFALGSSQDANDWGAAARTTTDFHVVVRSGTNTYAHRRWNGASWSAGDSIPNQTSLAGGGVALATDGTDVWCFVLDSAAGNAVRYTHWTPGAGWSSWFALEISSQTRNHVSATYGNGTIQALWTEGNSPFNLVGEQLPTGAPVVPPPTPFTWPIVTPVGHTFPVLRALPTPSYPEVTPAGYAFPTVALPAAPPYAITTPAGYAFPAVTSPAGNIVSGGGSLIGNGALVETSAQVVSPSDPLVGNGVLSESSAQVVSLSDPLIGQGVLSETSAQIVSLSDPLIGQGVLIESSGQVVAPATLIGQGVLIETSAQLLSTGALAGNAALTDTAQIVSNGDTLVGQGVLSGTGSIVGQNVPGTCTVTDVLLGTYTATVADAPLGIYTATATDVLLSTYTATVTDASPTYTATATDVLLSTYTATVADAI